MSDPINLGKASPGTFQQPTQSVENPLTPAQTNPAVAANNSTASVPQTLATSPTVQIGGGSTQAASATQAGGGVQTPLQTLGGAAQAGPAALGGGLASGGSGPAGPAGSAGTTGATGATGATGPAGAGFTSALAGMDQPTIAAPAAGNSTSGTASSGVLTVPAGKTTLTIQGAQIVRLVVTPGSTPFLAVAQLLVFDGATKIIPNADGTYTVTGHASVQAQYAVANIYCSALLGGGATGAAAGTDWSVGFSYLFT